MRARRAAHNPKHRYVRASGVLKPIKVRARSASTASLIIGQARLLRNSEVQKLKSVIVKPD